MNNPDTSDRKIVLRKNNPFMTGGVLLFDFNSSTGAGQHTKTKS